MRRRILNARSIVTIAVAVVVLHVNVSIAAWTITSPSDGAQLAKSSDVNCSGEATNAGVSYTVEIQDKNGVVRGSANGTSVLGLPNSWGTTVTRPIGDWDVALNDYKNTSITVTFVN
jgi:hypothetical protein